MILNPTIHMQGTRAFLQNIHLLNRRVYFAYFEGYRGYLGSM